jgi:uncharacterized membrane protein YgdD (TMEM256/DUF423 family)
VLPQRHRFPPPRIREEPFCCAAHVLIGGVGDAIPRCYIVGGVWLPILLGVQDVTATTKTPSTRNIWPVVGAVNGALAVALGAFGAHGLKTMVESGQITAEMLATFETAVRYQMYHALALVAIGVLTRGNSGAGKLAGVAFLTGIVIFSGMLYAYVLTGIKVFAMIVPIGGVSLIVGWIALAVALWRDRADTKLN